MENNWQSKAATSNTRSGVLNILKNKRNFTGPVRTWEDVKPRRGMPRGEVSCLVLAGCRDDFKRSVDSGVTNETVCHIGGIPAIVEKGR